MTIAKWAWACKGKARKGDTPGMSDLHVWQREKDGTATCKKCGQTLDQAEAADCFREW